MYSQIKHSISRAQDRRKSRRAHRQKTREIDALVMTELGFPPVDTRAKRRGWITHL